MPNKTAIRTDNAPAPFQGAPYSQGIRFDDLIFVSGQVAIDPTTGSLVEGGIREQTERVMLNLQGVLEAAGSSLDNLLKASVFLVDLGDFAGMNEAYARYVGETPPARATVEVSALPPGILVEIEVVAHV